MSLSGIVAASPPSRAGAATAPLFERLPFLGSPFVQVLILLVLPLLILLAGLIANLAVRRGVVRGPGTVTFHPSLAIRTGWLMAMAALIANLVAHRHPNWFLVITNLLALFELIRTFPRSLRIGDNGLAWRSFTGQKILPWEHISAFAQQHSLFGTDYRVYGNEDQRFGINTLENPDWRKIVDRIATGLAERHLTPSSSPPHLFLDSLHRVLLPAALLVSLAGPCLARF